MNDHNDDITKLIRLKRFEKPRDGYFEDFLAEFQSRQRSEMLHHSARSLFFERLGTYFSEFSQRQWTYASAAACAAVTFGFFLNGGFDVGQAKPVGELTAASAAESEQTSVLWEQPKFVLIEDEPEQITLRRDVMTREAEWDLGALPASATGKGHFLPVIHSEGSPEARPVGKDL